MSPAPSQYGEEFFVIFVGHSADGKEAADIVVSLQPELQKELDKLRRVNRDIPFIRVEVWTWENLAPALKGGQLAVVAPALNRADAAVFVFKEKIGEVTWEELTTVRKKNPPIPVLAFFPAKPPAGSRMMDEAGSSDWAGLLKKQRELSENWRNPECEPLTPQPHYDDLNHLKQLAFARLTDELVRIASTFANLQHLPSGTTAPRPEHVGRLEAAKVVDPPATGNVIPTGAEFHVEQAAPLTRNCVETMLANGPRRDDARVDCAVFAPAHVRHRENILVQIYAFAHGKGEDATIRAKEFDETASRRGVTTLEVLVHLGQVLEFHVALHGQNIQDPIRHLTWHGETTSVTFRLSISPTQPSGNLLGTVLISTGGVPVGRIDFKLVVVGDASVKTGGEPVSVGQAADKFRKAFVSYSRKDRPEVLRRIQLLRPPLTDIRVFQDILDLEPGERFKETLRNRIKECDIFLLFWSTNAQQSVWVQNEIQWACDRQGPNGEAPPTILPVIIEGPPPPPPPPQLGHLNFNDYLIYLIQSPGPTAASWGVMKMTITALAVAIIIAMAGMAIKWGINNNSVAVDVKDQPPKNSTDSKKSPAPLPEPPDVVDLKVGPFSLSLPKKLRRGDPINAFPVEGRPDAPGWIVAFSRAEGLPLWYVQDYKEIGREMTLRFTWVAAVSEAEVLLCQVTTNELPAAIRDKKSGFNRAELEKLLPQSTWSAPQQVSIVK